MLHLQDNGKVKKEKQVLLVNADTQDRARDRFLESMTHSMVDFEDIVIAITDSGDVIFVDVNEVSQNHFIRRKRVRFQEKTHNRRIQELLAEKRRQDFLLRRLKRKPGD